MTERKAKAEKIISQEPSFRSKEEALKEAMHQCRNLDADVTVWEKDGTYALVQVDNREEACIAGYKEVYDLGDIFDRVKRKTRGVDHIEEV